MQFPSHFRHSDALFAFIERQKFKKCFDVAFFRPDMYSNRQERRCNHEKMAEKNEHISPKPSIIELANNPDFSVATIAKEANRINGKGEGEVFISLH